MRCCRLSIGLLAFWCLGTIHLQAATESQAAPRPVVVIGFVGGMKNPEDLEQGVVQIRNRIQALPCQQITARTFRHWHWRQAQTWLKELIDLNHDGRVSASELETCPKIVLYGHSLGGWAVLKLARRMARHQVHIELAVQIDSVGIGDEVVPGNVKEAVNFYQRSEWPLRGERRIQAQSPQQTSITGNFLIPQAGHDAMARTPQISDFVTAAIQTLCLKP